MERLLPPDRSDLIAWLYRRGAVIEKRSDGDMTGLRLKISPADLQKLDAALNGLPRVHLIDAVRMAKDMRATRSSNTLLLGAASIFMPLSAADLEAAIGEIFGRKGEKVVAQNIDAFRAGRAVIESAAV